MSWMAPEPARRTDDRRQKAEAGEEDDFHQHAGTSNEPLGMPAAASQIQERLHQAPAGIGAQAERDRQQEEPTARQLVDDRE